MTTSAFSAMRSVILPLPSSPHWAPTTTSPGIRRSLRGWARGGHPPRRTRHGGGNPPRRTRHGDGGGGPPRRTRLRAVLAAGRPSLAGFPWSVSSSLRERGSGLDGALDRRSAELPLAIHIGELRIARQEREDYLAHWAVAVLRDDDVSLARTLRVAVVVLVAVDEHHE